MGLDMYVNARRYISDLNPEERKIAEAIREFFPEMTEAKVNEVTVESMYWRKANHIHRWFVDNVQDGVDECQESELTAEHLVALQKTCELVLADRSRAEELLPTGKGFFFGSPDYDDWYYETVEHTLQWLNSLLVMRALDDKLRQWEFYYQASW